MLGYIGSSRKQHDAGLAELERAVWLNPRAAFAHHLLARVLEFTGRSREAIDHLHRPPLSLQVPALADPAPSHFSLQRFEELAHADESLQLFSSNVRGP